MPLGEPVEDDETVGVQQRGSSERIPQLQRRRGTDEREHEQEDRGEERRREAPRAPIAPHVFHDRVAHRADEHRRQHLERDHDPGGDELDEPTQWRGTDTRPLLAPIESYREIGEGCSVDDGEHHPDGMRHALQWRLLQVRERV